MALGLPGDENGIKRQELIDALKLKTLNQLDEVPMYSNDPRVKVKSAKGAFQEVEIRAHSLAEMDTPAFWQFLEDAVVGFSKKAARKALNIEDHTPWKKLGQKWHFMRKGFPPGKKVKWEPEVLEELHEILSDIAPDGQFLWNNQVLVHLFVPQQKEAWASLLTKKAPYLELILTSPKNAVALGRIAELGFDREMDGSHEDRDRLRIRFRTLDDLHQGDLPEFLKEHLDEVTSS